MIPAASEREISKACQKTLPPGAGVRGARFLLASIGGAIGLGNIWRFPYIMGENGGGAFVFVYLVAAFLVAVPILSVEVAIGRHGRASPFTAMAAVSTESAPLGSLGAGGRHGPF